MDTAKMNHWLQVGANLGIILGLVLVGFQLKQNSDLLRVQLLYDESQSFINHERMMIGENGAQVWASSLEAPEDLSLAETRIMEAYLYAMAEQWRASHMLFEFGVLGDEWRDRLVEETGYYLGNPYARAWWEVYSTDSDLPPEMKAIIRARLEEAPDLTLDWHRSIMKELSDQDAE